MKTIYFVTGNKGKFLEAKNKFSEIGIEIIQKDIGYPEIQTDCLEEVAEYGIEYLKNRLNQPFILEDAGLFIESLDGFPGVFSAYVFDSIGCKGILKLLENGKNRKAFFKSVYAFFDKGKKEIFIGQSNGFISREIKGDKGFGYDPIFIPDGKEKTFAQMSISEKNSLSHRGKALDKLIEFFKKD
jgi:XTP/dITP diphosphohydrolase